MIEVYTDGSCHVSNPGPAGAGFVITQDGNEIFKKSLALGYRSNNYAELTAILTSLMKLEKLNLLNEPIVIVSDSQYCIGILSQGWKPKINHELIFRIKAYLAKFSNLTFRWVRGHDGNHFNEIADQLANQGSELSIRKIDDAKTKAGSLG